MNGRMSKVGPMHMWVQQTCSPSLTHRPTDTRDTHTHTHTHTHTYIHTHIKHTRTHTHTTTHALKRIYTHAHNTHTYTHAHINTHPRPHPHKKHLLWQFLVWECIHRFLLHGNHTRHSLVVGPQGEGLHHAIVAFLLVQNTGT